MCGGIGQYEVKILLNDEDRDLYKTLGRTYLKALALRIQRSPENYEGRSL